MSQKSHAMRGKLLTDDGQDDEAFLSPGSPKQGPTTIVPLIVS